MVIAGKNILITGGGNGIGKNLVKSLSEKGANIGVLDIDQGALDDLKDLHPDIYCGICDVSNSAQVENAVSEYMKSHNSIDVLVNNAAFIFNSPLLGFGKNGFVKHDTEMWEKVIQTDLNSVFYMAVNVVEKMVLKRTKGVVVNISSVCASGNAGQGAYSAAKAGVNALTVAWAKELSSMKIRFVGIAPGFVSTDTTVRSVEENVLNSWIKQTPARRLGAPDEISDTIIFAIENDFINGKIIEVDGGLRI